MPAATGIGSSMTRRMAAIGIGVTIALGIASRKVHLGFFVWDKSLGDALYTVMIYFFLVLVRPSTKAHVLGALSFVISFAIELFQLTGIPESLIHRGGVAKLVAIALAALHHFLLERRRSSNNTTT